MAHDFKRFPELTNSQIEFYYFESPHKQIFEDFRAKVIKVTDGDTITVRWRERDFDFPIRFLDINAPEMSEGGQESKSWLEERIEGAEVDILINSENRVGKFGRLLGSVIHQGVNMGEIMMAMGLAQHFTRKNEGKLLNLNKTFTVKQWF